MLFCMIYLYTHTRETFVSNKECTGSICLAYGLESCQCIPGPNDPPTKACELCCRLPGENQPCLYVYYFVLFCELKFKLF